MTPRHSRGTEDLAQPWHRRPGTAVARGTHSQGASRIAHGGGYLVPCIAAWPRLWSQITLAISLSARHWNLFIFLLSLWCCHGASIKSFPWAQASNLFPPGLASGAKPFSCKMMTGNPLLKAALMIAFSPGLMLGDTRTAPLLALTRNSWHSFFICSSLSFCEHCTCKR